MEGHIVLRLITCYCLDTSTQHTSDRAAAHRDASCDVTPLLLDASLVTSFWYCISFVSWGLYKGWARGYGTTVLLLHPQRKCQTVWAVLILHRYLVRRAVWTLLLFHPKRFDECVKQNWAFGCTVRVSVTRLPSVVSQAVTGTKQAVMCCEEPARDIPAQMWLEISAIPYFDRVQCCF